MIQFLEIPLLYNSFIMSSYDAMLSILSGLSKNSTILSIFSLLNPITSAANFLGGKYLQNCTMYITLEPCVMCAGALNWSQISKVVIGARDEQRGFINKNLTLHPKTEVVTGVMENECSQIVLDFFNSKR